MFALLMAQTIKLVGFKPSLVLYLLILKVSMVAMGLVIKHISSVVCVLSEKIKAEPLSLSIVEVSHVVVAVGFAGGSKTNRLLLLA